MSDGMTEAYGKPKHTWGKPTYEQLQAELAQAQQDRQDMIWERDQLLVEIGKGRAERDESIWYKEITLVRDYACKAAGLDREKAGWKTAIDKLAADLAQAQADVRRLTEEKEHWTYERYKQMREALESIAKNTCCETCQEAALVAKRALAGGEG